MNRYKICLTIYLTLIQSLSFICLVIWFFISIDGLAIAFFLLLALTTFSAIVFNFLLAIMSYFLSASTALLVVVSGITLFYLNWTIVQDLSVTPKIY